MPDLKTIIDALMGGDIEKLTDLVKKALDDGIAPKDVLNDGFTKGMDIIGEKMQTGEMFIPEVLRSANAMKSGVDILKPLLSVEDISAAGKVVIGTVKGDLHDIGKNLVKLMLESAGFEVVDLGVDVEPQVFIDAIKENNANILALSALLTTTMNVMKETVDAIVEAGQRDNIKIIIGGAPVTQKFADEIGADGYAPDGGSACKRLKEMMG
jgi:5-methyltetrahydrofolate--homocysteine methyltransferase